MITHQQREWSVAEISLRRQDGDSVFEAPVGVVTEFDIHAWHVRVQKAPHQVRLVAEHDFEARNAGGPRGVKCTDEQRLTEHAMEELGLTSAVDESIAIARGEHERPPDGLLRR